MTLADIIIIIISAANLLMLILLFARTSSAAQNAHTDRIRDDIEALRRTQAQQASDLRRELAEQSDRTNNLLRGTLKDNSEVTERGLDNMRRAMAENLREISDKNEKRLSEMRETVDEKLGKTLDERFNRSFTLIADQMDKVSKGLGEMQTLAGGVDDLKKVMTNVKTRGTWGEVQLGALLEQIMNPSQYAHNVKVYPRGNEIVEYAVVIPSKDENGKDIYLPIDSKFPVESYRRLIEAREAGDTAAQDRESKAVAAEVKKCGRDIRDKYIKPPYTTDFAIMFLPTESLYAEVASQVDLCSQLQNEYKVTVMGPNTVGAFLNSLQLGFRTLTIQKRSGEVWTLLSKIKKEFGMFGGLLEKVQGNLEQATKNIDTAAQKSRSIERRLENVQLPEGEKEAELEGE